jgi:NMT1-like family
MRLLGVAAVAVALAGCGVGEHVPARRALVIAASDRAYAQALAHELRLRGARVAVMAGSADALRHGATVAFADRAAGPGLAAIARLDGRRVLVCRPDADDALVRLVVATLFERRAELVRAVPAAAALDRRAAIETAPLPLHRAALRWFRDTKA